MSLTQTWDPKRYACNARFVSDLAGPVVDLLAPEPGERILDLGCGDGVLTAKLVAIGCQVVGVDSSAEQIAAARRHGVDGRVAEGENLPFAEEFDAVFSNAALHWMRNPQPVLAGVWHALRRKGRFVAEMGGYGCCAKIEKELIAGLNRRGLDGKAAVPWYFPTAEEYSALLNGAGFSIKIYWAYNSSYVAAWRHHRVVGYFCGEFYVAFDCRGTNCLCCGSARGPASRAVWLGRKMDGGLRASTICS